MKKFPLIAALLVSAMAATAQDADGKADAYRQWSATPSDSLMGIAHRHVGGGQTDSAQHYQMKYLLLKDTLLNHSQLSQVGQQELQAQSRALDEQMRLMQQVQQRQTRRLYAALAVMLAAALYLVLLIRKNRQLGRSNRQLYNRNVEILALLDAERHQWEESLHSKYRNSALDEAEKSDLVTRILYTLEHTDDIYSPDFSLEQLAQLVGSTYRNVSQVINERLHKNYSTLLGEYRIYKACRLLGDRQHYGHLTIEAIAQSVGFRSRTTFATAFRRVTGLTPSEYLAQAKQNAARDD